MLTYKHWVIIAYSEKLSNIIALWIHKNANIAFALAQTLIKMVHNSVKSLQMTSKFELELYFFMLYTSVNLTESDVRSKRGRWGLGADVVSSLCVVASIVY